MISRKWRELKKKREENKGAALVMVIIAIAFIGMLVAMILYMAYCNYLMKANDTMAKDNFYSAEYALDVIHAGLQMDISEAMSEAYVTAMKDSAGKDADAMEVKFQQEYVTNLRKKLQETPTNANKWSVDYLKGYWTKNQMTIDSVGGVLGAYLEAEGGDNSMEVSVGNSYITLSNLKIIYTDERGFVSIITTDLRLKVPSIGFAQSASKMSIENFALIANKSLINDNNANIVSPEAGVTANGGDVRISGNVFGGYDGVKVANQKRIRFVTNADDKNAGTSVQYKLIADSLNVSNAREATAGLYVEDTYETYVDEINLQTARIGLDGVMYVGNDLDIGGKRSVVTLAGKYYGYGNIAGDAKNSSSILINGGDTVLNFRDLKELMLSGHAYVGATKYDADIDRLAYATKTADKDSITSDVIEDEDEYNETLKEGNQGNGGFQETDDTIPKNEKDLMMGESISVKANQLLYMVPAECIGYKIETGEQVIAKNPMTYDEYKMLTDTEVVKKDGAGNPVKDAAGQDVMEKVYDPVRLSMLWNKLGGIAYTNDYKAVYRRVNGNVLVYLYLDFGSSDIMANEFYKAYYEYDTEGINSYVKSYISDMTWSSDLGTGSTSALSLAGNAFYMNGAGQVTFLDDHLADPNKYGNMLLLQEEYSNVHQALMHSLSKDYLALTSNQLSSEIFNSLVDENKLANMSGKAFENEAGDVKARISENPLVYPSTTCPSDTKLIVSKGDIFINGDFEGLAIAGGNIYICSGCSSINYNPSKVLQALRAKVEVTGGKSMYAYEVFGASGSITYGNDGKTEDEKVSLGDLIMYQDWKKE